MAKRITKKFLSAINESNQAKTKPYDTAATVLRVEGRTAWVHIDGGADETPVQLTIDAKPGDTVRVRVGGGQAWLTGNGSAPPTDDTVANKAEVKAEKADVLAQLAKKTADQAGKTATNYLSWSTEYGLVVSEDATENVAEMTGGNTRMNADGVEMYKGQRRVAKFGETSVIGDEDSAHVYLDPDTFNITNEDGVQFFSVDMNGEVKGTDIYVTGQRQKGTGNVTASVSETDDFANHIQTGDSVTATFRWTPGSAWRKGSITVVKGTPKTERVTINNIAVTFSYDGNGNYTASCTFPDVYVYFLEIKGTIESHAPSFTFGTRQGENGAFSASIGEGLIAIDDNQTVFGKYNAEETDKAVVVGGGTATNPKTIYTLDWDGKEWHYGDGVEDISSSVVVTATAGNSSISSAYFAKSGNIGMLLLTVESTQAIGTGLNIIMAKLPTRCWPIQYCTGVGYYDASSIVARISATDGVVVVRNASSSSVTLQDGVNLAFTYILA